NRGSSPLGDAIFLPTPFVGFKGHPCGGPFVLPTFYHGISLIESAARQIGSTGRSGVGPARRLCGVAMGCLACLNEGADTLGGFHAFCQWCDQRHAYPLAARICAVHFTGQISAGYHRYVLLGEQLAREGLLIRRCTCP